MRWKSKAKEYSNPNIGDTRVIKRFIIFPTTLGEETRWLEIASISQVFCVNGIDLDYGCCLPTYGWVSIKWED